MPEGTILNPADLKGKKEMKEYIKENGFFCSMDLRVEKNAPTKYEDDIPEDATYFEGVASSGALNRNGYIIRAKAWKNAIEEYMKNPVVLLQHDMDKPIGRGLEAKVVKDELRVKGYVFDDLTDGAFGRGLFKALSTGHITKDFEFENTRTGEIMRKEDFFELPFEERISDDWVLAVTVLEWVEFSVVSIGSNRDSFILNKNIIMSLEKNGKKLNEKTLADAKDLQNNEVDTPETTEEVVEDETVEKETTTETVEETTDEKDETTETQEEAVEEEETIETEEVAENATSATKALLDAAKVLKDATDAIQKASVEKKDNEFITKEQFGEMCNAFVKQFESMQNNINGLETKLNNIPVRKGLSIVSQGNEVKTETKKEVGTPFADFLKQNGVHLG